MELRPHQRRERGQRLPVQIVDGGAQHKYAKHHPSVGAGLHWNSMVATSPLVASLGLALGKYSTLMRRAPCAPQVSLVSPVPPRKAPCPGSATSSLMIF